MKYESLLNKVVVITGASSGIGKLAVEEFLAEGARVVLAARSEAAMKHHLESLAVTEDQAIVVKTDVADVEQVKFLARKAQEHFGRIDVWVNNAAVGVYATVQQLDVDEIRRVVDVNLMGQIHGMKTALAVFQEQSYGNIINLSSALGKGSAPLQSAYVATKHAIVGFSGVLREELMASPEAGKIEVSVILPASMDTPLFVHALSKMGRMPKPIPPVYDPMMTVQAILQCAREPRPELVVGGGGKAMVTTYRLAPNLLERYMAKNGISMQISDKPKAMDGNNNLFGPMPDTQTIRGGYGTTADHLKAYVRKHPLRMAISAAVPLLIAYGVLQRRLA